MDSIKDSSSISNSWWFRPKKYPRVAAKNRDVICLAVAADISSTLVVPTSCQRFIGQVHLWDRQKTPPLTKDQTWVLNHLDILVHTNCSASSMSSFDIPAQGRSKAQLYCQVSRHDHSMMFHQCSNLGRNSQRFQQKPDSLCLPDTLSRWCKGCNSLHLRFSQCQQWFSGSFQTTLVPSEVRIEVPNKVGRHYRHHQRLAIPNNHQDNCLDLRPSVSKVQLKQCLNIHTSSM